MYDNTNRGVLFKNYRKDKSSHPDYTGNINVDGEEKQIAAWIKEDKKGNKYMSLSVSEPYQKDKQNNKAPEKTESFDDDIPF